MDLYEVNMQFNLDKLNNYKQKICDHSEYKEFSVLIPIVRHGNKESILFEVRSNKLQKQPNEICFPGGKLEQEETRLQAAIRETCEELLIENINIKVVTEIDTLVTPFNSVIYPFAAYLEGYEGTFSVQEVQEVFTVPLDFLVNCKPRCSYLDIQMTPKDDFPFDKIQYGREYPWAQGKYPIYIYEYKDKIIWGITARILRSFIELIKV